MASMNDFIGRWKLVQTENFDEYMKEIGVGLITRKAAAHLKPILEIRLDGETWNFDQFSTFKNTKLSFKLGEVSCKILKRTRVELIFLKIN